MTKQEIAEIKKQFGIKKCNFDRIAGCYVDAEGNKKAVFSKPFHALGEEEVFKYLDLFKKGMSGKIGKTLHDLEFPLDAEEGGGAQASLMALKRSGLKDDTILEAFYDKIIGSYSYVGNYIILLAHANYDVPGKATDGEEMEDTSEEVYEYIDCLICPVELSKPGLGYLEQKDEIGRVEQTWMVQPPEFAFLFPAFNDRSSDIHHTLLYAKKLTGNGELAEQFVGGILGCEVPAEADAEKHIFTTVVEATLGKDCGTEQVTEILDGLNEIAKEHEEDAEPYKLDKKDVEKLVSKVADQEQMESFGEIWDSQAGDATLHLTNIMSTDKVEVKTPDVVVKVNNDRTDLIETREVDGRKCLVIALDGEVEVAGIRVHG